MRRGAAVGLVAAAALIGCSDESGGCQALALGDQRIESGYDTFVVEGDGSTRRFSEAMGVTRPSVTPDGRAVAATVVAGDVDTVEYLDSSIVLFDAEGEEKGRIPRERGTHDDEPAISPDGEEVAFVRTDEDTGADRLLVADTGEGGSRVLRERRAERLEGVSWSPDGGSIALIVSDADVGNDRRLLVIDAATGDADVDVPWIGWSTAWSWDGATIVGVGEGLLREVAVSDGTSTEMLPPDGVTWHDAWYRASDGAIVVLADGVGHDRLDAIDRAGRLLSSVQLERGSGIIRADHPVTVSSIAASRCFRPG